MTTNLTGVDFIDPDQGWICGSAGVILHTTDGGAHWSAQNSGTSLDLLGIAFYDANLGFAVGATYQVFRTTNGGSTWRVAKPGYQYFGPLRAVKVLDAHTVWAVGDWGSLMEGSGSGGLVISTDAGVTWSEHYLSTGVHDTRLSFAALSIIDSRTAHIAATYSDQYQSTTGDLYRTTDGGASFTIESGGGLSCADVQFLDAIRGFAALSPMDGWVLRTTDAGAHWGESQVGDAAGHISFVDPADGWTAATNGFISCTIDGGITWTPQASGTTQVLNGIDFVNLQAGTVVGANSTILHTVTGGGQGSAGVAPVVSNSALRLSVPTPNPFSHELHLAYALPRACPIRLAVYNVAGRVARVLLQEIAPAGGQAATWDGRDASGRRALPGAYFVRLEALGQCCRQQALLLR